MHPVTYYWLKGCSCLEHNCYTLPSGRSSKDTVCSSH